MIALTLTTTCPLSRKRYRSTGMLLTMMIVDDDEDGIDIDRNDDDALWSKRMTP